MSQSDIKSLSFELLAGGKYPVKVTLPNGTVKEGKAICEENIISQGTHLRPGMTDIEIDDLAHVDEIEENIDHDFCVEMICYVINEGSVESDSFDSGLKFELSNIPDKEIATLSM